MKKGECAVSLEADRKVADKVLTAMRQEIMTLNNTNIPSPVIAAKLCSAASYGSIQPVARGVSIVLAKNPKDYTGPGTNTYIVGDDTVWIIDPGPECEAHVDAVMEAVGGRKVAGIFVTHTHIDHSRAAIPLKLRTGAKTYGFGALSADILALTEEDVDADFVPDVALSDGQLLGEGDWQMLALHTPGHFPNHMGYMLPHKGILFSGDHVMGWSTTVVVPPLGNMAEYLSSLDRLEAVGAHLMLPSHGLAVEEPTTRIREVREHRMLRHAQVKECLERGIDDPSAIVEELYTGLTPRLIAAAEGCVAAHIELVVADDISMPIVLRAAEGVSIPGS